MSTVPTTIGQYTILRELGRGANGVVYLATIAGLDRRCALKVLPGASARSEQEIQRFRLEANVASKLESPGIARVWDLGWHGNHLYYVMDYCEGPTLRERLAREGCLPPDEAREIVQALAQAMDVAHARGVLHRDLKPSNVILAKDGPKITDFGLAQDHDLSASLTRTGQLIGTPVYMSPEQLKGEKGVDARVDVYALGVLLYECLTGRLPYTGASAHELGSAILTSHAMPPTKIVAAIPLDLEAACLKAMARDRDERYANAGELAAALGACTQDRPLETAGPARAVDRRWGSLVGGVVGLLIVAGFGLWLGLGLLRLGEAERSLEHAEQLLASGHSATEVGIALDEGVRLAEGDVDLGHKATNTRALLDAREVFAGWRARLAKRAPPGEYEQLLNRGTTLLGDRRPPPWLEAQREALQAAHRLSELRRKLLDEDPLDLRTALASLPPDAEPELLAEASALRRLLDAREALTQAQLRSRQEAPFQEVLDALEGALRKASAHEGLADTIRLETASYLFRRGRFTGATERGDALSRRPGRLGLQARYVAAFGRIWADDVPAGLEGLRAIWEEDPEGPVGLNAGAVYHSYNGMNVKGEGFARRSIALDPDYVDPNISLAFCLNDQRRCAEALEPLLRAEALQPDHPRLYMARAFATSGLQKVEAALANYERVIHLTSPTPMRRAIRNRMQILVQLNRHEELARDAGLLLKQDPRDVTALFWRGYAADQEGDEAGARRDWLEARGIDKERFRAFVYKTGRYRHRVRELIFERRRQ